MRDISDLTTNGGDMGGIQRKPADFCRTLGEWDKTKQRTQQRGLSASALAREPDELPCRHLKVEPTEQRRTAKSDGDRTKGQHEFLVYTVERLTVNWLR